MYKQDDVALADATPSSRYLQLIEGNSEGEHIPVPSTIARDRSLESTSGNYKRRGNSDTTKVPLKMLLSRLKRRKSNGGVGTKSNFLVGLPR